MKKLLILLALCMVFSVVLVACENDGTTEESTADSAEQTTAAPESEEQTTKAETEATTEEVTTEPEEQTTEPTEQTTPEEESTEPTPEPVKVIAAMSWDTLTAVHPVAGKPIVNNGGEFMNWNGVADIDTNNTALRVFGWIAYFTETEGTVGYAFNDGEHVYNESFTFTAEEGVQTHIATNCPGALSACRFQFDIPLEGLGAGTHKLCVYAKDTAGNEELIREITLNIAQVDPVEAIEAIEFDGTNGAVTLEAGETVKFMVRNQGGKKIVIENASSLSVTADNLAGVAVGLTSTEGTSIVQEIPGEGWDNIEITIHNATDAAATINFTVVEIG